MSQWRDRVPPVVIPERLVKQFLVLGRLAIRKPELYLTHVTWGRYDQLIRDLIECGPRLQGVGPPFFATSQTIALTVALACNGNAKRLTAL